MLPTVFTGLAESPSMESAVGPQQNSSTSSRDSHPDLVGPCMVCFDSLRRVQKRAGIPAHDLRVELLLAAAHAVGQCFQSS